MLGNQMFGQIKVEVGDTHLRIVAQPTYTAAVDVSSGQPFPLGATCDASGVNFAIVASHATAVDLCLFSAPEAHLESHRIALTGRTDDVWHGHVAGLGPGQLYGYRVSGPSDPTRGLRHDATHLLLDPYARAVGRRATWMPTPVPPLGAVVDDAFDWGSDRAPRTPWADTIIYETHVKGFTALHPGVSPEARGTYRGLASDAAIAHLRHLGVTAVELLPVHFCVDEVALHQRGLTNYWGYNTLGFFAPDPRLASASDPQAVLTEFKTMVKSLHAAGLEVLLDVVYNHTAEGDHLGPTLSMRGIDNANYYRLDPHDLSRYQDFTGCGNTLDTRSPVVQRLILDSLRYWVETMHVDGFRFDLASALLRGAHDVDFAAPLLGAITRDPVLSGVKLIAEPWDATAGGYQVGRFPSGWSEWNGRYRDDVRRFWRGDAGARPALATRLAGSSDLYASEERSPLASINFVTAHDGFTLADLVSYAHKHNAANGEEGRDGESNNFSANWGVEGPTTDPVVLALRQRRQRSLLLTLFTSQGVPMLNGGDELGRTQGGNNNAYCQDNRTSWTPWSDADGADHALLAFVRQAIALRRGHASLRRETFFSNAAHTGPEVAWRSPAGVPLTEQDWHDAGATAFAMHVNGDEPLALLVNAGGEDVVFVLPVSVGSSWQLVLASGETTRPMTVPPGGASVLVLRRTSTGSSAGELSRP
jgi:isoamylase